LDKEKRRFPFEARKKRRIRGLEYLILVLEIVLLIELFYTTGGIHYLLFAGVKGVAYTTDIHLHITLCTAGFKGIAASAGNDRFFVFRMYSLFHLSELLIKLNVI